jgi:hypothetical protein
MSCPDPTHDYEDYDMDYHDDTADPNDYRDDYYDDSMDGDHDSAMNSIGWDVDEGYGCFGDTYGDDF